MARLIVTLAIPAELQVLLFEMLGKITASAEPGAVHTRIEEVVEGAKRPYRRARRSVEAEPEAEAPAEMVPQDAWIRALPPSPVQVQVETPRNKVVYRVIDPSIQFNGQMEAVKCFLIAAGPQSAKQVQERLSLKQKSTESVLHQLRVAGCVQSEETIQ